MWKPKNKSCAAYVVLVMLCVFFQSEVAFARQLNNPRDERYVQVFSVSAGQIFDAAVDRERRGLGVGDLSIPRGTALPRRLVPNEVIGFPQPFPVFEPQFRGRLLKEGNPKIQIDPAQRRFIINEAPPIQQPLAVQQFWWLY